MVLSIEETGGRSCRGRLLLPYDCRPSAGDFVAERIGVFRRAAILVCIEKTPVLAMAAERLSCCG
jgi:hypothetical protein